MKGKDDHKRQVLSLLLENHGYLGADLEYPTDALVLPDGEYPILVDSRWDLVKIEKGEIHAVISVSILPPKKEPSGKTGPDFGTIVRIQYSEPFTTLLVTQFPIGPRRQNRHGSGLMTLPHLCMQPIASKTSSGAGINGVAFIRMIRRLSSPVFLGLEEKLIAPVRGPRKPKRSHVGKIKPAHDLVRRFFTYKHLKSRPIHLARFGYMPCCSAGLASEAPDQLVQLLLPARLVAVGQKEVGRAGGILLDLAVADDAFGRHVLVRDFHETGDAFEHLPARAGVFIIAVQDDGHAAAVGIPVAGVPADFVVIEQVFRIAVRPDDPVVRIEDLHAVPEVVGPDRLADDALVARAVRLGIIRGIEPDELDGRKARGRHARLAAGVVDDHRVDVTAVSVPVFAAFAQADRFADEVPFEKGICLVLGRAIGLGIAVLQ